MLTISRSLPNSFCKPYMSNQLVSIDDKEANIRDVGLRVASKIIKDSFFNRKSLLEDINKFVTGIFLP